MIIVTGTKRSGTSMWMQILKAAGFPIFGHAFPGSWGETIRDANPEGFYESKLRHGIYYATNPDPRSGEYLSHHETRGTAVKVFVPGLVRSDLAFVDQVLASMRHPREYASSLRRLYAMEHAGKRAKKKAQGQPEDSVPELEFIPPALEWWNENYMLLRDALTRRYPLHMVSYERVLSDPESVLKQTLSWLGGGDEQRALENVRATLRTQHAHVRQAEALGLEDSVEEVFEEFYRRVHATEALDAGFIEQLNQTHDLLEPKIREAQARARASRRRAMLAQSKRA